MYIDSEWQGSKGEEAGENDTVEDTTETFLEEPESKKLKLDSEDKDKTWKSDRKRLRGQNKSRPHTKPTTYDEKRLCLSVIKVWKLNWSFKNAMYLLLNSHLLFPLWFIQDKECPFGNKCHFSHDVGEYMASKPADVGKSCYLYDTFGKCGYGLSCRFAGAHTTPDFKTMENTDLVKSYEGRNLVKNSLSKDLQNRLRKRSVAFKKSEEYLQTLSNSKKEQRGNDKNQKGRHINCNYIYLKRTFVISL